MRAIVVLDGMIDRTIPAEVARLIGEIPTRYRHDLDADTIWTIAEFQVAGKHTPSVALSLARGLLSRRFYAHLVGKNAMLVSFPNCVVRIARDDQEMISRCQKLGTSYGIPRSQMRFGEMFDRDHPDAPQP